MNVSVVGLGNMGHPIAASLVRAKFAVGVWNRTRERGDDLVAAGATRAATVAEAARADIVVTMLADDAAVEHVAFGEGLVERMAPGAIHVSMSTISVRLSERLAQAHSRTGSLFVAAPVFGRPDAAAAAKLFVVAAGPSAALGRCAPIFSAIGQRTFVFGDRPEQANIVKLAGNFLIASAIESLGEAIALARKSGVDAHALVEMLTATLFAAPAYRTYGGLIADERYRPAGFRLPLGLKDVTLALDAARDKAVPLPIASVVRDRMLEGLANGFDDADWSALGAVAAAAAGIRQT